MVRSVRPTEVQPLRPAVLWPRTSRVLWLEHQLERAWWLLEVTVEEGLRELEKLCVLELVHPQSGQVVTRQVPEPSDRQKQLLDALKLPLPATVPQAQVTVGTRKKINQVRKPFEK